MLTGAIALAEAIKRAEERPSNDLPAEDYQAEQESAGWGDDVGGEWVNTGWADRC